MCMYVNTYRNNKYVGILPDGNIFSQRFKSTSLISIPISFPHRLNQNTYTYI